MSTSKHDGALSKPLTTSSCRLQDIGRLDDNKADMQISEFIVMDDMQVLASFEEVYVLLLDYNYSKL